MSGSRFELKRIAAAEWVIDDLSYDEGDPRRVVVCIWEADRDEYEVTVVRDLPMRRWYDSLTEILEDVYALSPRHTKPTSIPHLPPPVGLAATA